MASIAPQSEVVRSVRSARRFRLAILRRPLVRVVVRRLAMAIPLLFIVSALSFLLLSLSPVDAALQILGNNATPARLEELRRQLGLNLPVYTQYWHWLEHALRGDLGRSIFTQEPVAHAIMQRLPVSLSLIIG